MNILQILFCIAVLEDLPTFKEMGFIYVNTISKINFLQLMDKYICRCFVFGDTWGHLGADLGKQIKVEFECLSLTLPLFFTQVDIKFVQKYRVVLGWSFTSTYSVLIYKIRYFCQGFGRFSWVSAITSLGLREGALVTFVLPVQWVGMWFSLSRTVYSDLHNPGLPSNQGFCGALPVLHSVCQKLTGAGWLNY